jgi:hypothetical protein
MQSDRRLAPRPSQVHCMGHNKQRDSMPNFTIRFDFNSPFGWMLNCVESAYGGVVRLLLSLDGKTRDRQSRYLLHYCPTVR